MKLGIALGAALWTIWLPSGCSPPTAGPVAGRVAGPSPAPSTDAPTDMATTAELHADWLTPGSDALFAVESAPTTNLAWAAAETGAAKVVEGARRLQTGARPLGRAPWLAIAKELEDAAGKAAEAARARNLDALSAADGDMTARCEDCHKIYRDAGGGMMADPHR